MFFSFSSQKKNRHFFSFSSQSGNPVSAQLFLYSRHTLPDILMIGVYPLGSSCQTCHDCACFIPEKGNTQICYFRNRNILGKCHGNYKLQKTVSVDFFVTSRNGDSRIMQPTRRTSDLPQGQGSGTISSSSDEHLTMQQLQ